VKYVEPSTVDEVVGLLAEHGSAAKVLAGGQSLLILLRERFVEPDVLIGLTRIEDLRRTEVNGEARIGAMVTHTEVERDTRIAQRWPLLTAAEAAVSTVQVRNRGTLCGNVAHGFPTADPPPALIACGARIVLRSRDRGEREVPAEQFFLGLMDTAAADDELVTAVRLPPQPEGARSAYLKYAMRPLDFAIVNAAVRLTLAEDGTIADARIGLGGAANHPLRATDAEAVLRGESPTPEVLARAGDAAAGQSEPLDDVDGSPGYKRRVIGVYTRRALAAALA
jgi:carbon-monoxide dehydrogenase medium subunit